MSKAWKTLYLSMGFSLALHGCDDGNGSVSGSGDDDDDAAESDDDDDAEETADGDDDDDGDTANNPPAEMVACLSLIDDLESGSAPLLPDIDDRTGAWYVYNDETPEATQSPPACGEPFAPSAPGVPPSLASARSSGSGFTDWGAGFGFDLNNAGMEPQIIDGECVIDYSTRMIYDVSEYTGISFYGRSFKGPLNVDIKLPTFVETPTEEGGSCEGGPNVCGNAYQSYKTFTSEWQGFEIPFSDFRHPNWGPKFDLDLTQAIGLQFQTRANADFDIAIDTICFY